MTKARIVLVDDHGILRAGAAQYLADDFEIVGEAGDVQEAIDVAAEHPSVSEQMMCQGHRLRLL